MAGAIVNFIVGYSKANKKPSPLLEDGSWALHFCPKKERRKIEDHSVRFSKWIPSI